MKLEIRFLIKEDNTVIPFLIPETSVSLFSLQKVGSYNQDHLGKEDQGLNFFSAPFSVPQRQIHRNPIIRKVYPSVNTPHRQTGFCLRPTSKMEQTPVKQFPRLRILPFPFPHKIAIFAISPHSANKMSKLVFLALLSCFIG